ncbi:MAG: hypothetical protein WED83_09790, partial [Acidimicrobiia bacterium]
PPPPQNGRRPEGEHGFIGVALTGSVVYELQGGGGSRASCACRTSARRRWSTATVGDGRFA